MHTPLRKAPHMRTQAGRIKQSPGTLKDRLLRLQPLFLIQILPYGLLWSIREN